MKNYSQLPVSGFLFHFMRHVGCSTESLVEFWSYLKLSVNKILNVVHATGS